MHHASFLFFCLFIACQCHAAGWITHDISAKITYLNAERHNIVCVGIQASDLSSSDDC